MEQVAIYDVTLKTGDWFYVFARSEKDSRDVVRTTHFREMQRREFNREMKPAVARVPDNQRILVNDEDRGKQLNWTAKRWAKGETPGPFTSNTYDR